MFLPLFIVLVMAVLMWFVLIWLFPPYVCIPLFLSLSLTVLLQVRLLSVTVATDFVNPVIGYVASVYGEGDCLPAPPH